jgi:uncharacterized protein YdbL (DUF1318 family)
VPADDDIGIDEKRVHDDRREETAVWVASDLGVTMVAVAGAQIGRFRLVERCGARDLAAADGRLYVATDDDVLVGTVSGFEGTGFGPAVAVGLRDGAPVAADGDGRVAERDDDGWTAIGATDGDVRAVDGDVLAASDGVYHLDSGVEHAGLDDVRDVAATEHFAATATGLYRRRDGWWRLLDGDATVVAAGGDRTHAVVDGDPRERRGELDWRRCDLPVEGPFADVAHGEGTYAVTADGALVVTVDNGGDGDRGGVGDGWGKGGDGGGGGGDAPWRHRSLGLADVRALAAT